MFRNLKTRLVSAAWWTDALRRAAYTAIAIALPYFGGALIADVPWLVILSAAALGAVGSVLTSVAGLPEAVGVDLPWWLAAVERVVKTFAQALGAGLVGAVLISDVDWAFVLQAAALAALVSLLRLILATLPADPTPAIAYAEFGEIEQTSDPAAEPPQPKHLGAHNTN